MLVGVSHRLTRSTNVYIDREGKTSALKRWDIDGLVFMGSFGFHQRAVVKNFKRVCVMLSAAGVAVDDLLSRFRIYFQKYIQNNFLGSMKL